MFQFGLILLLVTTCCRGLPTADEISRHKRVMDGSPYDKSQYPYHVSLWYMGTNQTPSKKYPKIHHRCGGALIRDDWVITAAHCFDDDQLMGTSDPKKWRVYTGIYKLTEATDSNYRTIKKIIKNTAYSFKARKADIALVKLNTGSNTVAKGRLNDNKNFPTPTCAVDIIGWGATSKGDLSIVPQAATLAVTKTSEGSVFNEDKFPWETSNKFDKSVMCVKDSSGVGTESAAHGDSGSPVVAVCGGNEVIVGIVSYGHSTCSTKKYPNVLTNVSYYKKWIKEKLKTNA